MQNVLKKEETIVNSTTRSENIQIRDQPIWRWLDYMIIFTTIIIFHHFNNIDADVLLI